jgi:hypothetical protein
MCESHQIVETYRKKHAPNSQKENMGMMRQWQHWLTSLISGCDTWPFENWPEHRPSAMSIRENGYVQYQSVQSINQSMPWAFERKICAVSKCSINQSINQNQFELPFYEWIKLLNVYSFAEEGENGNLLVIQDTIHITVFKLHACHDHVIILKWHMS